SDDIEGVGGAAGLFGTAAVNLSGDVDVVHVNTSAYIGKSTKINCGATCADNVASPSSDQSVRVAAGNSFHEIGVAATLAIAGTAGVGVRVGVHLVTHNTAGHIAHSAQATAPTNSQATADAKEALAPVAARAGGGTA